MSAVLTLSADKAPLAGLFGHLSRQTIRPAQANMSAVLPLSVDKPPPAPGCSRLCSGQPSARLKPICQQYCPYPRISRPLPGCSRLCPGKPSARPKPICQQSCPYPRISRPLAGLFAPLPRQSVRPARANRSALLPLSAGKRPPRRAVHASAPANRPPGPGKYVSSTALIRG